MNYFKTALLLAAMTALFMGVGFLIGGATGALIALVVAAGMNAYAFWNSDQLALAAHGAQPVSRASAPELYDMVEELARNAELPTPKVFVIQESQPNAFATGRSPEKGAVAVTTGLMRMLSKRELAGVIAHELAHIKNRDTLIMTVAATIAGAISMLANFGLFFGASGGSGENRSPFGVIAVIAAALLAPFAAMLVQMLISRTREYAADRMGAEICGEPMWLAGALSKISGQASAHEMITAERDPGSAHLFIVNPLSGRRMDSLFATHPATENRIAALREMSKHFGGAPDIATRGAGPVQRSRVPQARRRSGPWG